MVFLSTSYFLNTQPNCLELMYCLQIGRRTSQRKEAIVYLDPPLCCQEDRHPGVDVSCVVFAWRGRSRWFRPRKWGAGEYGLDWPYCILLKYECFNLHILSRLCFPARLRVVLCLYLVPRPKLCSAFPLPFPPSTKMVCSSIFNCLWNVRSN